MIFSVFPIRALLSACIAAGLPTLALAQGQDSTARSLEPVTVFSARAHSVVGGAAAVVVRPDSARLSTSPTLTDLLRTVPQVLVRTNSRGETELSVRGSDSRQISLMLNGLPLSPSWDGRADASLIPLTGVSELVFIRSTGSLLGGPNAIGGTVDLRVTPATSATHSLSFGSDETGARLGSMGLAGTTDTAAVNHFFWRAGLGFRDRDGITRARGVPDSDPNASLRTNTDARQNDVMAAGGWRGARGASVEALLSNFTAERGVAPEVHLAGPRRWRYPEHRRSLGQLRVAAPGIVSPFGLTRVDVSAGVLDADIHIESFTDATYSTIAGREAGAERVLSSRANIAHSTGRGHEFRMALTVNDIRYDETLNANPSSRYQQRLSSLGAESQFALGRRSSLTGGVVLDAAKTLRSGGKVANPDRALTGWRVGATTALSERTRVHSSVSRRGRFPALRELYSGALNRFEPNPALEPEQLTAFETGMTRDLTSAGFGFQVVAFHHALNDAVVRVPFAATTRFIRVNRDAMRSFGTELGITWHGARGPLVNLDVVAQRVRLRDALAGADPMKPEHMPSLRATLDAQQAIGRGVTVGTQVMHVGSQFCQNPGGTGNLTLGAQQIVGVSAERRWGLGGAFFKAMRVIVAADNLTDAAMYEQCGLPRAGRTLRIGVSID